MKSTLFALGTAVLLLCAPRPAASQQATPTGFPITAVEPPKKAASVAFLDADGAGTSLDAFHGRVVLLNIWATWCGPCGMEMPSLDRLQAALKDEPFKVVAVSIDRAGKRPVDAFFQRTGLNALARFFDPRGRISSDLGTVGLPQTLMIDHEGRVVGSIVGSVDWDQAAVKDYLKPLLDRARACRCAATRPGPQP